MNTIIYVQNGIFMDQFISEIKKYIYEPSNEILFDIGSKDGNDARTLMNDLSISPINVYGFEAHPIEYKMYQEVNRSINWIGFAIYEYDGEIDFYIKKLGSGIHSIRDRGIEFGTEVIRVPCKKISTFIKEYNVQQPTIVKIDVEGCSLEILKSFEEYLYQVKIFHIESECEQYFKEQFLQEDVFNYLKERGFIMTMYSTTPGSNQHDSIWINSSIVK